MFTENHSAAGDQAAEQVGKIQVILENHEIILPIDDIRSNLAHLNTLNQDQLVSWAGRYLERRYRN